MLKGLRKSALIDLDFGQTALQLGARTDTCNGRWMELDAEDMAILHALLTRSINEMPPVVRASQPLRALADWCAAGVQWQRRGDK